MMNDEQIKADFYERYPELTNWEVEWDDERWKELEEKRYALLEEISGDPMSDIRYVKLRCSQIHYEYFMLHDKLTQYIRITRDKQFKTLAWQYGKASQTIHQQRGEIALLKEQLREANFKLATHPR